MTAVFIAIALKSLLVAGVTLGLLRLCRDRSPAERSCIAHFGLAALLVVAVAPLVLPRLEIEAPGWLAPTLPETAAPATTASAPDEVFAPSPAVADPAPSLTGPTVLTILYALPAFVLLLLTVLAIARLLALRARADVLVDGHWLQALARAQRRMGFKHGTALLTSNDLDSPISWGLMRPVILLNGEAVAATAQAEAIIAHELAHVARLDWFKLLLARVVTGLFWFNPLVWVLAREAHQLREETADDAVLAADIADTDYAELLVGVARHDCPGLLLGAHGVAPSSNSLSRRIRRVLDRTLARGPAARHFALGVLAGATIVAAPLAALTVSLPVNQPAPETRSAGAPRIASNDLPSDLPTLIASGVGSAVETVPEFVGMSDAEEAAFEARIEARERAVEAIAEAREARADAIADAQAARAEALAEGGRAIAAAGSRHARAAGTATHGGRAAVGLSDRDADALRASSNSLRRVSDDELVGLHVIGITPAYARELAAAGYPNITPDQLSGARAMGLTGRYAREMNDAGARASIEDLIAMKAVGVSPSFVKRARARGVDVSNSDALIEMFVTNHGPDPGS